MIQAAVSPADGATPVPVSRHVWSRSGAVVLVVALGMLLSAAAQKAYRLTLPTDGWQPAVAPDNLVFERNALGFPSPLQEGDELLAVEGQDMTDWNRRGLLGQLRRPANWQAGNAVRYTVRRGSETIDLAVPLYRWNSRVLGAQTLLGIVQIVPLVAITGFVFWKRPANRAAQLLLLFGATEGVILLNWFDSISPGLETAFSSPALFWIASIWTHETHAKIIPSLLLYLALTFPVLSPPARRFPRATAGVVIAVPLLLYGLYFLHRGEVPSLAWFFMVPVVQLVVVSYNVVRLRDPALRVQARWVGLAFPYRIAATVVSVLGFIGVVPLAASDWVPPLPDLVFTAALAIAVLRYRLLDIDVVVNHALVYGVLTAFVVGVYSAVVGYVGALLQVGDRLALSLVASALVAILLQPLRERVQRGVNRVMYGERDEPYAVLSRLGRRLESTLAIDDLLPTITETIARAMKLPYAALYIHHHNVATRAAEYSATTGAGNAAAPVELALPLVAQGEMVGELRLRLRGGERELSAADRRLLGDLTRQAGMAVQATRLTGELRSLTEDLQLSRERLVTAREEERRRLRRDLHDGLGPQLASLSLKVDAARNLLRRNPERADAVLESIGDQMQATIADIRRLVYELRPPALDQLGLATALQQYAAQLPGDTTIVVDASGELPPLPAAVEVAAYRITLEALTNVLRHAAAGHCVVQLCCDDRALLLAVSDDGQGLPAQAAAGVGLRSMRERAAELGGVCTVERQVGGGTVVRARLPLAVSADRKNQWQVSAS